MSSSPSLFERIGGQPAVAAAVDHFYGLVLADPLLQPFFEGRDTKRLQAMQKVFLTQAFGGPAGYDGEGLRAAHAPLVAAGLSDAHFDAVAGHLAATLEALGVPEKETGEVMAIAASTRNDVLCREPRSKAG